jgi:hypothetical protein
MAIFLSWLHVKDQGHDITLEENLVEMMQAKQL